MIKKILLLLLTVTTIISCNTSSKKSECGVSWIGGKIVNPKLDYVVISHNRSIIDTVALDSTDSFIYKIENTDPGIYFFSHYEYQAMFLEPGDSVMIYVNTIEFDESLSYTGRGAEKNNLLMEFYLLNEDADVDPGFLEPIITKMESDKNIGIAQSLILLGEERDRVNTVGNAYHFLGFGYSRGYKWTIEQAQTHFANERKTNPDLEIAYASGAGMMVRISALQNEELFHGPFFLYHEDTDTSFMMRLRGYNVVVIPESVIYHWYEFSKSITKFYWMERNRYAVLFMYLKPWTLFLIMPLLVAMEVALALFALARGWWPEKKKVYKELGSASYQNWVRERRQEIQKRRKINDREFTKYFVAEILFQHDSAKSALLENIGNPLMKGYWWVTRKLMS